MPATQGAPPPRRAVLRPGTCPSRSVSVRTRVRAAVVLWTAGALVVGTALAGCEYTYNEGWRPAEAPAAPEVTEPGPRAELWRNDPVSAAEMEAWLTESQVGPGLQVAHRTFGLLRAEEIRTEATAPLPTGTYVLVLVCRSQRRVEFKVRNDEFTMVDLSLRCGSRRESVIYLSKETVLHFQVEAPSPANFAYRLARL
ncbi:hypothetical protein [Arthrobacter sp. Soil762]|uniref:hypothetical protein n=1 Tax=Arthrobacter sp. Soil762 TaxID=1736401 RepID=UPI0006F7A8F3|nr:hypothetical protein [Arthrobacter sp. Soil762]KRE72146.1 hypothetical protein ASG77_09670 [Arthrobacter sp. Soil762]